MTGLGRRGVGGIGVDCGSTGTRWARWTPSAGVQSLPESARGRIVANLPADDSVFRTLPLPPVPRRELSAALKWELQRILPFPVEEAVFDYMVLAGGDGEPSPAGWGDAPGANPLARPRGNGQEGRVVVAGAPVETVDARYRQLAQQGIRPYVLEPDWTVLWRIARFLQLLSPAGRGCAVIDLGHRSTRLLVAGPEGSPVAFHRATAGGAALEEELAGHLGVPLPELRRLRDTELWSDAAVLTASATVVELLGDVNRLFRRVRQEIGKAPVDVWAIGGGAMWPALVGVLTEAVAAPVAVPGQDATEGRIAPPPTGATDPAEWARQAALTLARCHPQGVLSAGLALWHGATWAAVRRGSWFELSAAQGAANRGLEAAPVELEGVGP